MKKEPLNIIRMTEMYRSKLNIDVSQARELAKITKGYAYAFQELGVLCFKKKENETLEDILSKLKSELFAYSYEKIWEEMTEMDRKHFCSDMDLMVFVDEAVKKSGM